MPGKCDVIIKSLPSSWLDFPESQQLDCQGCGTRMGASTSPWKNPTRNMPWSKVSQSPSLALKLRMVLCVFCNVLYMWKNDLVPASLPQSSCSRFDSRQHAGICRSWTSTKVFLQSMLDVGEKRGHSFYEVLLNYPKLLHVIKLKFISLCSQNKLIWQASSHNPCACVIALALPEVLEWNRSNPNSQVLEFDRIVAVNRQRGTGLWSSSLKGAVFDAYLASHWMELINGVIFSGRIAGNPCFCSKYRSSCRCPFFKPIGVDESIDDLCNKVWRTSSFDLFWSSQLCPAVRHL